MNLKIMLPRRPQDATPIPGSARLLKRIHNKTIHRNKHIIRTVKTTLRDTNQPAVLSGMNLLNRLIRTQRQLTQTLTTATRLKHNLEKRHTSKHRVQRLLQVLVKRHAASVTWHLAILTLNRQTQIRRNNIHDVAGCTIRLKLPARLLNRTTIRRLNLVHLRREFTHLAIAFLPGLPRRRITRTVLLPFAPLRYNLVS